MTTRVAICIATFRRPRGLRSLLRGIDQLVFEDPAPHIEVIVVDNDASERQANSTSSEQLHCQYPLRYVVEQKPGVAAARNRALDLVEDSTEFIAMIDDDEIPDPHWLAELLRTQQRTGAAIIQGVLRPKFEQAPPSWIIKGGYFEIGPFTEGQPLDSAGAGNCLVRRDAFTQHRFDEAFGLSGGEDEELFGRLGAAGNAIAAAPRALVEETIPASRTNMRWLLRRYFRKGNTLGRISRLRGNVGDNALRCAKGCARVMVGLPALLAIPISRTLAANGTLSIAWGLGSIAGVIGYIYVPPPAAEETTLTKPAK